MAGWLRELRRNIGGAEDDADPLVIHVVGTKSDIVAEDPGKRRVPFERTIAYVAEQLYPSRASTPPPTAGMGSMSMGMGMGMGMGLGFGSGVFGTGAPTPAPAVSPGVVQSPDSKRSSAFWGQDIGWDCCHEISAKDGEGIDEVFRVITRKLVEQRNRRDAELALSAIGTPGIDVPIGPFTPGGVDGNGSFRLGYGDKRRSWLGLATPTVGEAEEVQVMSTAKKRGRCC